MIVYLFVWSEDVMEKHCGSFSFQKEEQCARSSGRSHTRWKGYIKQTLKTFTLGMRTAWWGRHEMKNKARRRRHDEEGMMSKANNEDMMRKANNEDMMIKAWQGRHDDKPMMRKAWKGRLDEEDLMRKFRWGKLQEGMMSTAWRGRHGEQGLTRKASWHDMISEERHKEEDMMRKEWWAIHDEVGMRTRAWWGRHDDKPMIREA